LAIKKKYNASPTRLGITLYALATIFRKQQRFSDAEQKLTETWNLATQAGDRRLLAFCLQEKARLCAVLKRDTAIQLAHEALAIWKSLGSKRDIEDTQRLISRIKRGREILD